MRAIRNNSLLAGIAVAVFLASGPGFAETLKFKADLRGSSEVPPNDSAGRGTANISFDTDTKKLTWTVNSSGLSGEATAAHFHGPAAVSENAGPVVDVSNALASGSAEITEKHLADLQAGRWYLNIHTEKFPDGEIRGQVEKAQ
ncbi:CHRD domain-containing protein [Ensifer aridi]|uniref:CHRD domain-containing protein n=1 Tax=Ensifer aridi TaxID=1708715 RepID=UPI000A0F66FD|nr:CHRD domain-containing protein [Ensifer aridi]